MNNLICFFVCASVFVVCVAVSSVGEWVCLLACLLAFLTCLLVCLLVCLFGPCAIVVYNCFYVSVACLSVCLSVCGFALLCVRALGNVLLISLLFCMLDLTWYFKGFRSFA